MKYASEIEQIIAEADDLPSLPWVTQKILKLTLQPETSLKEIGLVVSTDAALSVRFLKIVNSAYFGFSSNIKDIQQAVSILGVLAIRNIAITLSLFDVFPIKKSSEYKNLFKRSLTAAIAADFISQIDGKKAHPDIFLAGLLQNLGMFILMRYLPEKYEGVFNSANKFAVDLADVEEAEFGTNHIKIGTAIGKKWDLPIVVRASIQFKQKIEDALSLSIPAEAKLLIKSSYLGGLAADIYWGWNKAQNSALFKKQLSLLFDCEQNTADDVLSSVPHLVTDSGYIEVGEDSEILTYDMIKEKIEEEIRLSTFKKKNLYKTYIEQKQVCDRKDQEIDELKEELQRSNTLVQKLALKLKD